jgi:GH24 family phage-related lysozyme (muramidase)
LVLYLQQLEIHPKEQRNNYSSFRNNNREYISSSQNYKAVNQYEFAVNLLIPYEGFNEKAVWDYGAWRIGYGSGTITLNNGTYRTVKQGDTTNKENAFKDLQRRVKEFEKKLINQVGQQYWDPLNNDVKGALISIAYNYGGFIPSLTKTIEAIKTGNNENIASTIESETKTHNKSKPANIREALYKRRLKEAKIIRESKQPASNKIVLLGIPLILLGFYLISKK